MFGVPFLAMIQLACNVGVRGSRIDRVVKCRYLLARCSRGEEAPLSGLGGEVSIKCGEALWQALKV
jgi:hypothetical protein